MAPTLSFEWPNYAVSDEAAAYVADMLMEVALQFEAEYFGQIQRHYESLRPQPHDNAGGLQLDLFDNPPPF